MSPVDTMLSRFEESRAKWLAAEVALARAVDAEGYGGHEDLVRDANLAYEAMECARMNLRLALESIGGRL